MNNQIIEWLIIGGYMAFIFGKGVLKFKKIEHTDDYLVAGRTTPWILIFTTLGATVIGGGASIGAVAKTYELGLVFVFVSTGVFIQFIFSGLLVAPQFRRWKLYTVAGYFGRRYDEKSRFVAFVLSLIFSIFIIAAQMAAFGSVLSTIFPEAVDNQQLIRTAIIVGGFLVVVYSTAGGLVAVIWTDIYQFIILFGGFLLTLIIMLPDLSANWGTMKAQVPPDFFSIEGGKGWIFLGTTFLAFLLGETFGPAYVTRFLIGKDIKNTKWGIAGIGIFLTLTFPFIIYFIAMYAKIHFPEIDPQQALPFTVQRLNNVFIASLIIAAILSAVMSSADSALNSCTAIFVKDLFEHHLGWDDARRSYATFIDRPLTWIKKGVLFLPSLMFGGNVRRAYKREIHIELTTLVLARMLTAGVGITATAVAVLWPNIIDLLLFTYHVWAPTIIVPIVVGALSREFSPRMGTMVFVTMIVSMVATMSYRFGYYARVEDATFDPAVFGVIVSLVVFYLLRAGFTIFGSKEEVRYLSPREQLTDEERDENLG